MLESDDHGHDEWDDKVQRDWTDCMERERVFVGIRTIWWQTNNGVLEEEEEVEGKLLKLWQLEGAKHA